MLENLSPSKKILVQQNHYGIELRFSETYKICFPLYGPHQKANRREPEEVVIKLLSFTIVALMLI